MASFKGQIVLEAILKGERNYRRLLDTLSKVEQVSNRINAKPINLFAKGRGSGLTEEVRVAIDKLQKSIIDITNSSNDAAKRTKLLGNTFAGTADKARALSEILQNVSLKTRGLKGQEASVKNLARAWAVATQQAREYSARLDAIQNDALREAQGLQPQAERDIEVERRRQALQSRDLANEKKRKKELAEQAALRNRALNTERKIGQVVDRNTRAEKKRTDEQKKREKIIKRTEKLLTGVGFPLLFGGGPAAVAGGGIGGAIDALTGAQFGFAIFAGAIGQAIDGLIQSARDLGAALRDPVNNIDALAARLPDVGTGASKLRENLRRLGLEEVVAADAVAQLAEELGGFDKLQQLKDDTAEIDNIIRRLTNQLNSGLTPALLGAAKGIAAFAEGILNNPVFKFFSGRTFLEAVGRSGDDQGGGAGGGGAGAEVRAAQAKLLLETEKAILDVLRQRVQLIKDSLTLRRDTRAAVEGQLKIEEALNAQRIAQLSLEAAQRRKAGPEEIFILDARKKQADVAVRQAEAERDINEELARRAILLDKIAGQRAILANDTKEEQLVSQNRIFKKGRIATLDEEIEKLRQITRNDLQRLKLSRQAALVGKTEQEVIDLINKDYDERIRLRKGELYLQQQNLQGEVALLKITRQRLQDARQLQALQAESAAAQQIRQTDPNRKGEFLSAGFGFFNESAQLAADQTAAFTEQLGLLDAQAQKLERTIASADFGLLPKETQQRFTDELAGIKEARALYTSLQPAIDASALAQARFNEAFAITSPLVDNVVFGLRDVLTGTKTAEEAFASFLNTVADMLLKTAAEMIATYIAIGIARQFAGLGGGTSTGGIDDSGIKLGGSILGPKEVGGRTMANMPYVVGEKGAELFVPGKTGTIVPADVFEATRQAIAGNAPDGGDSDAFAQNSVALGNTATITKEKSLVREMGMRENEPIDVRYESTVINNVSYVSEEQFQKGLKIAVAQSRASVFSDLKNKPASRSSIGL